MPPEERRYIALSNLQHYPYGKHHVDVLGVRMMDQFSISSTGASCGPFGAQQVPLPGMHS